MKSLSKFLAVAAVMLCVSVSAHANKYPKQQDPGAVEVATTTVITVSTTPAMIISTGTGTGGYNFFSSSGVNGAFTTAQYLDQRLFLEIYNDSSVDIFVGYDANVSSITGKNLGHRIKAGGSLSKNDSIMNMWAVSGSDTGQNVVITQEK